jgi:hypothetical protein
MCFRRTRKMTSSSTVFDDMDSVLLQQAVIKGYYVFSRSYGFRPPGMPQNGPLQARG